MKKIILRWLNNVLLHKNISISAKLKHSKVRTDLNNSLTISLRDIQDSMISVIGSENYLCIEYSDYGMNNCHFRIQGYRNRITLGRKSKLKNLQFTLIGNDCIVKIDEGFTIGSGQIVCMGEHNSLSIGKDCMLAENVDIWNTDSHPIVDMEGNVLNPSKPITIGNHVWVGKGSAILKGVTIGDDAIIGMRSLVTKDIESYSLNVGCPSHTIRRGVTWERDFIKE